MAKKTKELEITEAPPPLGVFIRDYLREYHESYASELHRVWKETYRGSTTLRGKRYKLGTYNSFAVYISKLILMGLIERTGRTEESNHYKAEALEYPERVFIRLTSKGDKAPEHVWLAPLRLYYHPFDWELPLCGEYIK